MKRIQKHYHWVIALLAFLEMILFGGILNSAGVFILPITDALAVTRGSYALAMVPYSIACTFGTMLSGFLFQKWGYRRSTIFGLALTVVSLGITACCRSLTVFCISKVLLGLSFGVCFTAGAVRIVRDWFFQHQGLIIGAVSMASGLGGSLMTLVLTRLIASVGWRMSNVFLAGAIALAAVLYLLLMKDRPEELGLQPYGYGVLSTNAKAVHHDWPGLTFRQWLHRPLLYLMVLSTLLSCLAIYLTHSILIPHFQDQGLSADQAAGYQSTYMLVLAAAKLICGAATDRIGAKPVSIFCLACSALGQLLLSHPASPVLCYAGVCLCGIGLAMTSSMIPLLAASLFGYQGISSINSIVLAMTSLANIFANPIANLFYDRSGTYSPVFISASVILAVLVCIYCMMFAIAKKEKIRIGD